MIWNIIDKRTNKYKINVDVVYEPSFHDNSINGASIAKKDESWAMEADYNVTVKFAIDKAIKKWKTPVTVYLYDLESLEVVS